MQNLEVSDLPQKLLNSQKEFLFSPEPLKCNAGGWGSGKSRVACLHGLLLSAYYPGNEGIIGRYHGTDLNDSTIPVFWEVCPQSWVKSYNKATNTVILHNGSRIYFRHIHDAKAKGTKSRRVGSNLGWFLLDQMEEMEEVHFDAMVGRLRNPRAGKKFGLGTANPAGHDWIQKKFFPNCSNLGEKELFRVQRRGEYLGIMVDSNENRISNGGFVEDAYFDRIIANSTPDWVARYIRCSFDEFTGKIYKEFHLESIHNIKRFSIPRHWQHVVSIDVGGDCPWGITDQAVDDWGNMIVNKTYKKATVKIADVAEWIKNETPWNNPNTSFIIDPENKVALVELAEHGIHCRPAKKAVLPGILRTGGYYKINPGHPLPDWYEETQPNNLKAKFKNKGSPRTFVFDDLIDFRREADGYIWDDNKINEPKKTVTERFDLMDSDRYAKMFRPEASKLVVNESKHAVAYRQGKIDYASYREWEALDKRIAARQARQKGAGIAREVLVDNFDDQPEMSSLAAQGKIRYDWGDGGVN